MRARAFFVLAGCATAAASPPLPWQSSCQVCAHTGRCGGASSPIKFCGTWPTGACCCSANVNCPTPGVHATCDCGTPTPLGLPWIAAVVCVFAGLVGFLADYPVDAALPPVADVLGYNFS
ncbi:hypothetical protein ACHHYP_04559 [Achlya hypogyna]|uniref:Secreted protein n=1 Tax=Achlya hypogyna TaxID=1202772 RepID=A0A1V9Z0N1_ACHHY|nr:hypothetical protein ACHHYP_04559 [Achlya hypogyna]